MHDDESASESGMEEDEAYKATMEAKKLPPVVAKNPSTENERNPLGDTSKNQINSPNKAKRPHTIPSKQTPSKVI